MYSAGLFLQQRDADLVWLQQAYVMAYLCGRISDWRAPSRISTSRSPLTRQGAAICAHVKG